MITLAINGKVYLLQRMSFITNQELFFDKAQLNYYVRNLLVVFNSSPLSDEKMASKGGGYDPIY